MRAGSRAAAAERERAGAVEKAQRRFLEALGLLVLLMGISAALFSAAYHVTLAKGLYLAIMVMTTVGADAPSPQTTPQYLLEAFAALGGVSVGLYTVGTLTGFLVGGDLRAAWGRRKMERHIDRMSGHIVIAGGGRVGQRAAEELRAAGQPRLVIIEADHERSMALAREGYLVIEADATDQGSLLSAGIRAARGLVTALPTDAENLYTILAAREMNPGLVIVARAEETLSERRLRQAGAQRVVVPARIGGRRLARLVLQPTSAELIDSSWLWEHGFDLVDLKIQESSAALGASLRALLRDNGLSLVVVARERGGSLRVPPDLDQPLTVGDRLFVSGTREELARLQSILHVLPDTEAR